MDFRPLWANCAMHSQYSWWRKSSDSKMVKWIWLKTESINSIRIEQLIGKFWKIFTSFLNRVIIIVECESWYLHIIRWYRHSRFCLVLMRETSLETCVPVNLPIDCLKLCVDWLIRIVTRMKIFYVKMGNIESINACEKNEKDEAIISNSA